MSKKLEKIITIFLGVVTILLTVNTVILVELVRSNNIEQEPPVIKNYIEVEQPDEKPVEKKEEVKPNKDVEKKKEDKLSDEVHLLARIINAEAKGQPYEGKVAVGNVVMNRVASPGFPNTIKEVVYQKGQFSPVRNGAINKEPSAESIKAAKDVLNGKTVINKKVLYFYNPTISTSQWIFTRQVAVKIGDHAFAY